MNHSDFVRSALVLFVVAAMLGGCGGAEPPLVGPGAVSQSDRRLIGAFPGPFQESGFEPVPLSPRTSPLRKNARASRYDTSAPLLYVTNYTADYNDVKVYHAKAKDPSPIAVITNGINTPSGDCIDGDGTLYVTNQPGSGLGWISEYFAGKTEASKFVTSGINTPAYCAIDRDGNLWITNIGARNVTEYEKGATKPHTVITSGIVYPTGIAFDHSGNMYVANRFGNVSEGPGNVVIYSPRSKSPRKTITDDVVSPEGIAVDAAGTLYVTNWTVSNVEKYQSGASQPYQTITQAMNEPVDVAVNKEGWLYVTNVGNNVVVEFQPGSIMPSRREINKGLYTPQCAAYFPTLLP